MIEILKKIVEESSDLVCTLDADGKILWTSKSSKKILGFTPSLLKGKKYSEFVQEADLKKWEKATSKVVSRENLANCEIRHIHKEGHEVLLLCSLFWESADKKFFCIGKKPIEVTEAKKGSKSSEEMYRLLFDLSPIPKHVYDLDSHQIIDVNQAAIDHYGYSREEFLKMKIQDLRPESEIPRLMSAIKRYKTTTGILRFGIFNHQKKDGSIIKMDISGQKFSFSGQLRVMVICIDVTQQQDELKQKKLLADIRQVFAREIALKKILEDLLVYLVNSGEFHLGEIWLASRDQRFLSLTTTHPKSDFTSIFYEKSSELKFFKKRVGLPGTVWNSKQTEIWDHLGKLKKFIRKKAAKEAGLISAMGIPMVYNGEVLGVLILGSRHNGQSLESQKHLYTELETIIGPELKRKQLEEDYNQIFNTTPDIICMIDFESSFKRINPAGCKLLGYSEYELLNMPYSKLVLPDDRLKFENQIEEYSQRESTSNFIHRVVTHSGEILWLDWNLSKYTEEGISYGVAKNITEQNELQKLLDDATDLAKIGGWEVDLNANSVYWSPMTKKLHEVDHDFEPDLDTGINFYRRDVREIVKKYVDSAIEKGDPWDFELPIITAKGRERWIKSIGKVEFKNNKPNRIVGSFQDITYRKTAELAAQEALLERNTILESISDAFFAVDWEWKVTYWNRKAEELMNKASSKIVGKNLWDVYAHAVGLELYTKFHEAVDTGKSTFFESYYPTADRWFEISAYPSDSGLSVYFKDITQRKISSEKLRQSNERFENVAKATNDAIYDWDIVNNDLFLGEGFNVLFGHDIKNPNHSVEYWIEQIHPDDKDKAMVEYWIEQIHPDDKDKAMDGFNSVLQHKKGVNLYSEYRYLKSDGTYAYVINRGMVIRDDSGVAQRIVGAVTDISQRKDYEESLQELNENLEQHAKELAISNSELEQFAFVTSHDLQEPLRMISSFLTQLERKYGDQLDEKAHQYIFYAVDGAKRMRQIILDLLDFSTIGKSVDLKESIDINEIVNETCQLQRNAIEESGAIIIKENLPTIKAQRTVVAQIFQNLIGNALKYRRDEVPPEIVVSAIENKGEWNFSIKDNGIGIEEEYFDKIFNIFQKLHSKDKYEGTGMGLAIAKKSVENLGGKIWVESTSLEGSNFIFSIKK